MLDATCIVIILAYQAVWGKDVVYLEDLENLSSPDARKLDLFYKGMMIYQVEALQSHGVVEPDIDPEELFGQKESILESLNDVFILKPSIFGFGININEIIKNHLDKSA